MDALLDSLASLPLALLYLTLAAAGAVENFFPPVPADSVVAIGSFLAARDEGSAIWAFVCTWIGNVTGAMIVYALGRRFGAARLERRMLGDKAVSAEARLRAAYSRYGVGALFVSRFVPGVRAIVPPFAGALGVPAGRALLAIASASALWYGLVSWVGFRLGSDWDALSATLQRYSMYVALAGGTLFALALLAWWLHRRSGSRTA